MEKQINVIGAQAYRVYQIYDVLQLYQKMK